MKNMVFKICITKLSNKKHHVELLTPIRETTDAASGCRIRDASGLLGVVFVMHLGFWVSYSLPRVITVMCHRAPLRVITHRHASSRTASRHHAQCCCLCCSVRGHVGNTSVCRSARNQQHLLANPIPHAAWRLQEETVI